MWNDESYAILKKFKIYSTITHFRLLYWSKLVLVPRYGFCVLNRLIMTLVVKALHSWFKAIFCYLLIKTDSQTIRGYRTNIHKKPSESGIIENNFLMQVATICVPITIR